MKKKQKIKDEYFIRVKKRILRETKDSDKKFTTTFKEIKNEPQLRLGIENLTNTRYRNYLDRQRYFADALGRNFILSWVQNF